MSLTGPCIGKLSSNTAKVLSERIRALMMSEFWKFLGLGVLGELKKSKLPLPIEE
jgi:hypothetical protein